MKKAIVIAAFLTASNLSSASFLGNVTPSKIYGDATIRFGANNADANKTCSYFGRNFKFDATTGSGKNMFSILLAAHMAGKEIDVWYKDSGSPGTTQSNGCTISNMAVVNAIGFSQ